MTIIAFPLDAVSGAPDYTGQMLRAALSALAGAAPAGRPLGAVSSVRRGTPSTTVTATGTTWTVNPHSGILDLETSATAGPYFYAVTVAETGAVTAASALNDRIDLLTVRTDDPSQDATSVPAATLSYYAGTPAASPVAPATPTGEFALATIRVPKSGTGSPSVTFVAPAAPSTGSLIGEDSGSTGINMTTDSNYYAFGSASVTFTLPTTRRVRIYSTLQFSPATVTSSHYYMRSAYNTGSSVGTPISVSGLPTGAQTASTLQVSVSHEGTVLLTAGTYTAYPSMERTTGSATDSLDNGYVAVYDAGSA